MYVIGMSECNLLNVQYVVDYVTNEMQIGYVLSDVELYAVENGLQAGMKQGFPGITAPTVFPTLDLAKKALAVVKELGEEKIHSSNVISSLIDSKPIDVDELRIFKLGILPDWQCD